MAGSTAPATRTGDGHHAAADRRPSPNCLPTQHPRPELPRKRATTARQWRNAILNLPNSDAPGPDRPIMSDPAPLGHNRGPSLAPGSRWAAHCWRVARADLLPHLPIEVVRTRVRRAAELGLDYRTYAGVRARTGRDLIAFLFSESALALAPDGRLPPDRRARLEALRACERVALIRTDAGRPLDRTAEPPAFLASDPAARTALRVACGRHPAGAVALIAVHDLEAGWAEAAQLATVLSARAFFAPLANQRGLV